MCSACPCHTNVIRGGLFNLGNGRAARLGTGALMHIVKYTWIPGFWAHAAYKDVLAYCCCFHPFLTFLLEMKPMLCTVSSPLPSLHLVSNLQQPAHKSLTSFDASDTWTCSEATFMTECCKRPPHNCEDRLQWVYVGTNSYSKMTFPCLLLNLWTH